MTRRANERAEVELLRRQAAERKGALRALKENTRARLLAFRDSLRAGGAASPDTERDRLREVKLICFWVIVMRYGLVQWCKKCGPRAKCGPRGYEMWPAEGPKISIVMRPAKLRSAARATRGTCGPHLCCGPRAALKNVKNFYMHRPPPSRR